MLTVGKKFVVELSETEVKLITTALHREYTEWDDYSHTISERKEDCRNIRNEMANLIGRSFMGKDA